MVHVKGAVFAAALAFLSRSGAVFLLLNVTKLAILEENV